MPPFKLNSPVKPTITKFWDGPTVWPEPEPEYQQGVQFIQGVLEAVYNWTEIPEQFAIKALWPITALSDDTIPKSYSDDVTHVELFFRSVDYEPVSYVWVEKVSFKKVADFNRMLFIKEG